MLDVNVNGQFHALIPQGVADYFWDEAAERRLLEDRLLSAFAKWGYGYIIPPTLEYAATFEQRTGLDPQTATMYRFLDHDGQSLALRYDMTVSIARLVGTRLHDAPMPQRFCYAGNIFRHGEPQAGQQREFWQAGIELIGANTPEADAEVLALTAKVLQVAGLADFKMTLGQCRFFNGLLDELALSRAQQLQLRQAIERRSEQEFSLFIAGVELDTVLVEALETFMTLSGDNVMETIDSASRICLNKSMESALDNLQTIYKTSAAYNIDQYLHLDLTEISDLGYYTGIRFMAYAPGLGFGIASGGRYDNLIGTFGPPQPAVGVAIGIERLLLALQSHRRAAPPLLHNHILVATNGSRECYQIIERLRSNGVQAVVEVNGRYGAELWKSAQEKAFPCALSWRDGGFDVYDDPRQLNQPSRRLTVATADDFINNLIATS